MTVKRRTNPIWGLLAVAAAGLLVANALGYVPVGLYDLLLRAAPALLIVAGLTFLLKDRIPLGSGIALIAGIAVTGVIAATAFSSRVDQVRTENNIPIDQPIGAEVGLLRLRVESGATDVELIRSAGTERRVSGEFIGSAASVINADYTTDAGAGTLIIREALPDGFPLLEAVGRGTLRVELPADIPLDIDFVGANGAVTMNLSGVSLERLNLVAPSGNVAITLPTYTPQLSERGDLLGTVTVNSGDLTVFVPASVGARFELNRAGSGIDPVYDPNLYDYLVGDVLEADSYDTAATALRYTLNVSRGQIRIQVSP